MATFWKTDLTLLQRFLSLPMASRQVQTPEVPGPPQETFCSYKANILRKKEESPMGPPAPFPSPVPPFQVPLFSGYQREQKSAVALSLFPSVAPYGQWKVCHFLSTTLRILI